MSAVDPQTPAYASFAPPTNRAPPPVSPLLASTPPTISLSLSRSYPLLLFLDRVLSLLTWTSDDPWASFLVICSWVLGVLYFDPILKYTAPLLPVVFLWGLLYTRRIINRDVARHPGLDHMVHTLSNVASRTALLVEPLTTLANNTTQADIPRLALAALSIAPFYALIASRTLKPRTVLLLTGVFVLTYHSVYARVTRAVFWRSRSVRRIAVYLTGGSASAPASRRGSRAAVSVNSLVKVGSDVPGQTATKFVFVLYENQRRWLGIGWTPNLLAYERAPWTDEFLNPSSPPSSFQLPEASSSLSGLSTSISPTGSNPVAALGLPPNLSGHDLVWRWSDRLWKLDLTNDGALVVNSKQLTNTDEDTKEGKEKSISKRRVKQKSTLSSDPGPNDGWIYYDNTWKKPSTEDAFMKYTRRRRWVRTAELVSLGADDTVSTAKSLPPTNTTLEAKPLTEGESPIPLNVTATSSITTPATEKQNSGGATSSGIPEKDQTVKPRRKSLRFAED